MDMQALIEKLRPKRLRARLLLPVVVLVAVGSVGITSIEDFATRRQIEQLTHQKGSIVLQGILQRLQDRKKAKALFVELLAEQPDLATLIETTDRRQLTQLLLPLKIKLGIDFVKVYDVQKRNLLLLSSSGGNSPSSLIDDSLTGVTKISTLASQDGLAVVASAPVKGVHGIAGVVVIGSLLTGEDLESHKGDDAIDLAIFDRGTLANITSVHPEVKGLLQRSKFTLSQLKDINEALSKYNFHAVAQELDNGGLLLALIPTQDLISAADQRKLFELIGLVGLLIALLLFELLLARDIAQPLESMVDTTQDIIRGNYNRLVPSSNIQEMQELGKAINYLAQQLQVQISKLTYQAFHDPLTNLPNRPLFEDRLHRALVRAQRSQNTIAVLFLDLDGFKLINDSFGHKAGDRLLVMVSERLDSCLRDEDTLARLGGDEFTILLENIQDIEDATSVANRIAKQLELPFSLEEHEIFISASIGIAISTGAQSRPEDFLRDADAAMYAAKKNGKANHQVFNLNMASQARQQLLMEAELRRAIERQEFRVYYQPVIHLDTGKIVEVEALVRWQHPLRGLVPPLEFIPLAEDTGLIIPLGQWILEQACKQLRAWHLQYPSDSPLVVGVNLSTKQFQQSQLEDKIAAILQEQNLEPGSLKLEITESVLLKDTDANLSALQKLKNLGVKLAIDDFGTGFSALNYLKRFPIDTIKIDRSFVNGLGCNAQDTAIVHAIIAFAKALNLGITAEGIETADQLALLRELNCDRGQGYYFSKPLTSEAIGHLLASSKTIDSRSLA
jgi:diguanylate cyclase (GGDEF)-like protein